jgi:putative peptide zinc metalloprotease protein
MNASRAKVELLVRDEGGGWRTGELSSAVGYLRYRPHRLADAEVELSRQPAGLRGAATYVIKNRRTEQYIQVTEPEKFLWERMDGRASVQDIATAYVLRFGAFDFEVIPRLMAKLYRANLLVFQPASSLRRMLDKYRSSPAARALEGALRALERVHVASRRAHGIFERAYQVGAFLFFSPVALVALAAMVALGGRGAAQLWPKSDAISAALAGNPLVAILLVKVFFLVTLVSHQVLHGLALIHYGRTVKEFGFVILHGFVPTFYADVTDIFMAPRRARIVTALSGPLVHLFLGALYFWFASLAGPGLVQGFLAASAVLQLQSLFISLYPFCFIEMDGYHILVDALGMPTLKEDSMRFFREGLWGRVREGFRLSREEAIYVSYVVLSTVSVAGFIWFNVWLIARASS